MISITQRDVEEAGFIFLDSGSDANVFDSKDILITSNNEIVFASPEDCFANVREALIDVITTGRGSYRCFQNTRYFCGAELLEKNTCSRPAEVRRAGYCSEKGTIEFVKVELDSHEPSQTDLAIDFRHLTGVLDNYAHILPRIGNCRCDFYEDVCEVSKKLSVEACKCDPDCEPVGIACMEDNHCDSYCPSGMDPDCDKRDANGRRPRSRKRMRRNIYPKMDNWKKYAVDPSKFLKDPPIIKPFIRPRPVIDMPPIIEKPKPVVKKVPPKPRIPKPPIPSSSWRVRRSCGWRGDCTTYLSPH